VDIEDDRQILVDDLVAVGTGWREEEYGPYHTLILSHRLPRREWKRDSEEDERR
jgi:hypothetical protein